MNEPAAPHPDSEALSALIDGEGTDTDRAHTAECAACRGRMARLEAVGAAIGTPVEPDHEAIEAGVVAALAAWTASDHSATASRSRPRRYAPPAAWVGIAAVVLALLVAVPLLTGQDNRDLTAAGDGAALEAEEQSGAGGGRHAGTATSQGSTVGVADFGEHNDTATLVALLSTDSYAAPPAATAADAEADADEAPASGDDSPTSDRSRCVDEGTRVAAGRAGPLVMTGPVIWRGEDAVVVVFAVDPDDAGRDRQLYVMSRSGCDVLAEQRF